MTTRSRIILEGSDGLGKTVAANRLIELIGSKVSPGHLTRKDVTNITQDFFPLVLPLAPVWDRFHLGSLIYGNRLRLHPTCCPSRQDELRLCRTISSLAVVVVMFSSDTDSYRASAIRLGEERNELDSVGLRVAANGEYWKLMSDPELSNYIHVFYDVARQGYPNDDTLLSWLEIQHRRDDDLGGERAG
jgi:hypothetical protein